MKKVKKVHTDFMDTLYITQRGLTSVYHSLVYSRLQYAICCSGNSSEIIKRKLQVKQNCIIKTLCKKFGTKSRLKLLYEQLQVLNIHRIYTLRVANLWPKSN